MKQVGGQTYCKKSCRFFLENQGTVKKNTRTPLKKRSLKHLWGFVVVCKNKKI
jgi:hypothetical protein